MRIAVTPDTTPQSVAVAVADYVDTLRDKLPDFEVPTRDEVLQWVPGILTGKGEKTRMLRRPGKRATDQQRALHAMILWHGSAGSLWGPIGWQFRIGQESFQRVDTLAQIMRDGNSRACEAWTRALGI